MSNIELLEELHSNTRRTRITYRGFANGQDVAIKCYLKPLFGVFHWLRAVRRGKKIRAAGGAVPEIVYSGWISQTRCFGLAMAFLEGYTPLRDVLRGESDSDYQKEVLRVLGRALADLHRRGIEQPDGNLTNFLLGRDGDIKVVDEDDIRVISTALPLKVATMNLANVAARLPDDELVNSLVAAYLEHSPTQLRREWSSESFIGNVRRFKLAFEQKRRKRNIDPLRRFD